MKKVILYNIIIGILLVTMSGCSLRSSTIADVIVCSVESSNSGNQMICKNSQNTYICEGDGIYVYNGETKEIIVEQEGIRTIGCTEQYVYYKALYLGLYRYSIETGETELLLENADVEYINIKSDIDTIFIVNSKSIGWSEYDYDILLYNDNGEKYYMADIVNKSEPIESQEQFDIYDIGGYNVAVDTSIDSHENPEIAYIWNDNFEFSCSPNNTYLECNEQIYRIEKYLSQVVSLNNYYGGIDSAHVYTLENQCYFIAQFSSGTFKYQKNPARYNRVSDYYCKYDVETGEFEQLYKTEYLEQIVGIAPDEGYILILRANKLIQYYYGDGSKNQIYELGDGCSSVYFEYFDGQTYIWEVYNDDYDSCNLSAVLDI
jgi:hypothetical protein